MINHPTCIRCGRCPQPQTPYPCCALQNQTCKVCGRRDKFNFAVDDATWAAVVPEAYRNLVVCLACFDDLAQARGIPYSLRGPLYFAGDQETLEFTGARPC